MSIPIFRPPDFRLLTKRTVEIPFAGAVAGTSWLTLVTNRITYPFRILRAKMVFGQNANNLVQHYWLISTNSSTSITGVPSGDNIFSREAPVGYFAGHLTVRIADANLEYRETGLYVKLVTYNGNAAAYNLDCSLVIQEL